MVLLFLGVQGLQLSAIAAAFTSAGFFYLFLAATDLGKRDLLWDR
jgi:hypothetical protein